MKSELPHRVEHPCIKRAVAYGEKLTLIRVFISLSSNMKHTRTTAVPLLNNVYRSPRESLILVLYLLFSTSLPALSIEQVCPGALG